MDEAQLAQARQRTASNKKRILLIDENEAIHEDFRKALETHPYLIDSAFTGEQALKLIQCSITEQRPYTMGFIDLYLKTGWDGITTLQRIWEAYPGFQMAISMAYTSYSWQELTLKFQNADRYLILNKPFSANEIRQLAAFFSKKLEINAQIQAKIAELENHILYQSTHDQLTGLDNQHILTASIQQAIEAAKQHKQYMGVLLVGFDNLKEINTVFGYRVGDGLLKQIADSLKNAITSADSLIRLRGNEIVIILTSQAHAEELTNKIYQLNSLLLGQWNIENQSLRMVAYSGASIYPDDAQDPEGLLKNANAALYQAKEIRSTHVQFYIKEYHEQLLQRMELMTSLIPALNSKQFDLLFQPLVQPRTSQIIGVEAQINWQHPSFGLLHSQEFIPLAEKIGLITSLNEWVLKAACTKVKKWQGALCQQLRVAVPISAQLICQGNFVELINKIVKTTELTPHYLDLEITMDPMLEVQANVLHKIQRLKEMGITITLNQYGIGYDNLTYLHNLPFDQIKVDKRFVHTIQINEKKNVIIDGIIDMAKKVGIKIVAESVALPEQIEYLFNQYGEQIEGYYFSPSLTEEAFIALLERQNSTIKEGM